MAMLMYPYDILLGPCLHELLIQVQQDQWRKGEMLKVGMNDKSMRQMERKLDDETKIYSVKSMVL